MRHWLQARVCALFTAQTICKKAIVHFENNLSAWMKDLNSVPVETYTRQKGEAQFLIEKLIDGDEYKIQHNHYCYKCNHCSSPFLIST